MKRLATLPQREQVLNLFAQKKPTAEQMQRLTASGYLSLLARATVEVALFEVDPFKLAEALLLPAVEIVPFGQRYEIEVENNGISPIRYQRFEQQTDTIGPEKSTVRLYSVNCGDMAHAPTILAKNKLIGCNERELIAFKWRSRFVELEMDAFVIGAGTIGGAILAGSKYWEFPAVHVNFRRQLVCSFRGDDIVRNGGQFGKCFFLARRAASQTELQNYITDFVDRADQERVFGRNLRGKPVKSGLIS